MGTKDKHQITSTCLCRSGFSQAGQITNKFQLTKFKTWWSCFGAWSLEFICDLEFGVCNLKLSIPVYAQIDYQMNREKGGKD
jgi:hypothetical protein